MSNAIDIAIVGATTAVGEALIELLQVRQCVLGKVHLLSDKEHVGSRIEYKGQYLALEDMTKFDFSRVSVAIFCVPASVAAKLVPKATKAGCLVIDGSAQFRLDDDVPLVVPEINGQLLAGVKGGDIIAAPDSAVVLMLLALEPLHRLVALQRIDVTVLSPVSNEGKDGVETLAAETVALLNMREVKPKLFPRQVAFNVVPRVGALMEQGHAYSELRLQAETNKILSGQVQVNATCVQVPVFFGDSLVLHAAFADTLTTDMVATAVNEVDGLTLYQDEKLGSCPTAVTEAAGSDEVFIGRVRADLTRPNAMNLWVVGDNVRRGCAGNLVAILEYCLKNS